MKKSALFSLIFVLVFSVTPSHALQYALTPLGTLGGIFSMPMDINDNGEVVGYSTNAYGLEEAFLWQDGIMTGLGDLPGGTFWSRATGINNGGKVTGYSSSYEGKEAFLWQSGSMTGLGDLPGSGFASEAYSINGADQVAGFCMSTNGVEAALWEAGEWTGLGDLPGDAFYSRANDINDLGQVVGYGRSDTYGYQAFWYENGTMEGLGALKEGSNISDALAVNNQGWAVGWTESMYSDREAFIWRDGIMTGLGFLAGERRSVALDVNDSGQIVGSDNGEGVVRDGFHNLSSLNDMLDDSGNGYFIETARAINNNGVIAAFGITPAGQRQAFLLTPTGGDDDDLDEDGYSYALDCNDTDPGVYPGAQEVCGGNDDDCDGLVDEGFDEDGDHYPTCAGDCDDSDPTVNIGMAEVKHDGKDQDCNGYDLTIDITLVDYNEKKDTIKVEATSALGASADLYLQYSSVYAPMSWNKRKDKWTIMVDNAGGDPGSVMVEGTEGYETASTAADPPCNPVPEICGDGIDNDCDGRIDGKDKDCR